MKRRVLLIGNGAPFLKDLAGRLQEEGLECVTAHSGEEGLAEQRRARPDVIAIDVGNLDGDPRDLCRRIRSRSHVPIVVLGEGKGANAQATTACLEQGADSAISEARDLPLAVAHIRAQLRRSGEYAAASADRDVLDFGRLRIDLAGREVTVDGEKQSLTPKEFDLLATLARNAGRVMRSSELLRRVWGYDEQCKTRTLDVHINRLRSKIEADPRAPGIIVTVTCVGYKLCDPRKTKGSVPPR